MIKKYYISVITLLISSFAVAQKDTLLELGANNTIRAFYELNKNNLHSPDVIKSENDKSKGGLLLPFIDDFSQNHIYPDQKLWEDMDAYVNSSFADNPITYGVATLDGLDSTGTPYNFLQPTSYGTADSLTSRSINLSSIVDSVFLSFYYQPQGKGNKPETQDSIRLEFKKPDGSWERVWGAQGSPNQPFQQVMIPVDSSFHGKFFQFRFRNWATLSGNVDHWNIDYVYLNDNRNHADTALNDVSFITNHHSLLNEFTAMPWSHYLTDTIGLMKTAVDVTYKNNHSSQYAVFYKIQVIDNNGAGPATGAPYPFSASSHNVFAYSDSTISHAISQAPHGYNFPSDASTTKVFQIKNYFDISPNDNHLNNDTVNSYQVFGSYYSYDDGSAEVGYGIQGIGSKLAHEFDIKKADTLKAFQIYFTPIMNNLSAETFRLKVWSSLSPEVEIYSQQATQYTSLEYTNTNEFKNYYLDDPLYLTPGTYYFGWEKISPNFLNVGWDVNTNSRTKVHYNAVGVWQNPTASIPDGSLMLRPVFGSIVDPLVSINDNKNLKDDFDVYPNPSSDKIYFKPNNNNYNSYHVQLLDIYGKVLLETESSLSNSIDVSTIANGIYIVRFTNNTTQNSILKKVIVSK